VTSERKFIGNRAGAVFLAGTILGGWSVPVLAQAQQSDPLAAQPAPAQAQTPPATPAPAPAPTPVSVAPAPATQGTIRSIAVRGNQRLEPETIRSYANLSPGQSYSAETLDTALKDLYGTELFSDVVITGAETGTNDITDQENPDNHRNVLERTNRTNTDKILP
jgi:outer membrane protein insertion porin family